MKWDDNRPTIGSAGWLFVAFVISPVTLAALALWLWSAAIPWPLVVQTAVIVAAIWAAAAIIIREIRRQ